MNTFFKHQESHQFTWYRYNSRIGQYDQKTQIDFILSTRKSIIKDVKAIPSVSLDSDHRLVKGKMKIHLPEKEKARVRKRVKTENLKTSTPEIQQKLLEEKDNIKGEDIEEHWGKVKHCLQDIQEKIVGVATLGNRKKKRTGWWTEDVKAEVDRKKELFRIWLKNRGGILNLVTSRGRKSGRKSVSCDSAVTVVNWYSEIGFSEVSSHLRHAHHTCENQ